jgi:hypothetical protein
VAILNIESERARARRGPFEVNPEVIEQRIVGGSGRRMRGDAFDDI